jgi:two-component system response regulator DevR
VDLIARVYFRACPDRQDAPCFGQQTKEGAAAMASPSPNPGDRTPIKVFLLDDHDIVRRGIADLLRFEPDIDIVGEAGSVAEALARIPAARPDVALLDVRLGDGSGIDVCRDVQVSVPGLRCIMLTSFDDDDALFAAVMAGAAGYLLKQVKGPSLVEAIRQVADGRSLMDPSVTGRLLTRLRDGEAPDRRLAGLNEREREILGMITEGFTNRQIGEQIFLSEQTVKNLVSALLSKLGMQRRTQAAAFGADVRRGSDRSPGSNP